MRLTRIVAEQEETIIQLREASRPLDWTPPVELGLTVSEARIVADLYKGGGEVRSKDQIFHSLYHDRMDDNTPEMKIVDVLVCKLRKKLKAYGIEVVTDWGRGYHLDEPSMGILKGWGVDHNESVAN
jgi:two-component system cell cycle response regulator CtrA